MRRLNGITDSKDMCLSELRESVKDREAYHAAIHGGRKQSDTTEQLNWIELNLLDSDRSRYTKLSISRWMNFDFDYQLIFTTVL